MHNAALASLREAFTTLAVVSQPPARRVIHLTFTRKVYSQHANSEVPWPLKAFLLD